MSPTVREALTCLDAAANSGELARSCARQGIELLVLFGSAARGAANPSDIDLAIGFARESERDVLAAIEDFGSVVPGGHLDVLDLDRAGPVARVQALTRGRVLVEARRGAFTEREMSALGEYLDTAYLRAALLRELAR